MRLHAITLGCQMSASDSSEMVDALTRRGFSMTDSLASADAVLISTCTVRQHAEDRALSLIGSLRPWKEERPSRLLIVAGCAAERLGGWLKKRFPYVDLVVGAKSIESFDRIAAEALEPRLEAFSRDADARSSPEGERPAGPLEMRRPAGAYVTIMRGCNYSCSYCIVPAVRGRESCRPPETVLEEVRRKVGVGAMEVTLLGTTVNSYRSSLGKKSVDFADLLRLVSEVPGLKRLRFMSPHPYYITERMVSAMADCGAVCESMHLPAQSGSDRLLKLMRRSYTRGSLLERVELLRSRVPEIELSTDIIVGFPTETEEDFQSSLSLLSAMGAWTAYCFKYSPRESTEAARWNDDVSREVKEERLGRLNRMVDEMTSESLRRQVGKDLEVLTERPGFGRTRAGLRVGLREPAAAGRLVSARICGATRLTLEGTCRPRCEASERVPETARESAV